MKKNIKFICAVLITSAFCSLGFSQGKNIDSKSRKKNSSENAAVNPEENQIDLERKSYVIIEPETDHILDPQLTSHSEDSQVLTGLYEGLFSYNPSTLEPVPAIASSYKISRDKKRWIFTINSEACFSNGEKITAKNVRDSWIKLLANPMSPYSSLLDVIEGAADFRAGKCSETEVGIYAQDVLTLSVKLSKPANYLPKLLCHTAFSVVYNTPGVYSGPYVLKEASNKILILRKNPYYWDKKNVEMEQITFIQSSNKDENTYMFNTGMVDWITGSFNLDKILNKDSIVFNALFGTSFFFFRGTSKKGDRANKIFDNKKFRQALFEAFPWEQFRKDYYFPAETFVYPLKGYPNVEGFNYTDMIEAKKLMAEARKEAGVSENEEIEVVIEISANSFNPEDFNKISEAWKELNVKLNLRQISYGYYSHLSTSDADIGSYSWIGDFADPLSFLELYRSDSSLNESGWKNKRFDELLDLAAESDAEQRYKYLAEAETLLLDDYTIFPLYHSVHFNVINTEETGGWSANAFDIHPLKYLKKNEVKSKIPNVI